MDKIVILGGNGFLGTHVARAFTRRGYEVHVCSRSNGVDARKEGTLEAFLEKVNPAILVNCAQHGGGISYNAEHPLDIYEDNLMIGFQTVRAIAQTGVKKFVNIMGNTTYPGVANIYRESEWWNGPLHSSVIATGLPRKAQWVHSWAYQQQGCGFRSIHLVLPNMFGPGDHLDPSQSHALTALIRKIWEAKINGSRCVEIWGSGKPIREWLYVEDAAEGIVRAAGKYEGFEILNLGSGQGCSVRELAETIREQLDWPGEFFYDTARPDGAPCKIFDVSKMKAALNWAPPTELRDGIRKTIDWFVGTQHATAAAH
jgi:GDP-L-fucose synthase